jgi:phosphinothricin acetyltransferase
VWDSQHLRCCRLLAWRGECVTGWAALRAVSDRPAYSGVAEVSVYVAAGHRSQGVGRVLLQALIAASERQGLWTLQASIFPENAASLGLHADCGFRTVGIRRGIGRLEGAWRDVVLMERRGTWY